MTAVPNAPAYAGFTPPPATLVTTVDAAVAALTGALSQEAVGLDTETTALPRWAADKTAALDPHRARMRLLQLATPDAVSVIDLRAIGPAQPVLSALAELLASERVTKVFQNAAFDLRHIRTLLGGAPIPNVRRLYDTMLAEQIIASGIVPDGGYGLAALARRYLGVTMDKAEQTGPWGRSELTESQRSYAALDAAVLVPIYRAQKALLRDGGLLTTAQVEFAALPAIADMEYDGMAVDVAYLERLRAEERAAAEGAARTLAEVLPRARRTGPVQLRLVGSPADDDGDSAVNLDSPAQVLDALRALGVDVASTNDRDLAPHRDHPAVAALLAYRRHAKLLSAFLDGFADKYVHPVTGRVHPDYVQIVSSGRMSCRDPNIQQWPHDPRFRRAFVAAPGHRLVIADYSGEELRIMAHHCQDERMLEAFRAGQDLHKVTASLVLGKPLAEVTKADRQISKSLNFGLLYGMGAEGFRSYAEANYGLTLAPDEATDLRERFFAAYPGLRRWHHEQRRRCERALEVRTLLGRRRRWASREAFRATEAWNTPIQGTGADILKKALAALRPEAVRYGARIVAAVHDEIVSEVPEDVAEEWAAVQRGEMVVTAGVMIPSVPWEAEVGIGTTWADKA